MYAVIKQQLKYSKYKSIYPLLKELTHISKNLYNQALYLVRQEFFNNSKYKNYYDINKELHNSDNYLLLQSGCAQQTLQMVDWNFKGFFAANAKNIKANIPKYLNKDGYFKICDSEGNKHVNKNLYWTIPLSKKLLTKYNWTIRDKNRPRIKMPNILKDKKIHQIWIIPKHKGKYFEIQYVYENNTLNLVNKTKNQTDQEKYLSIDLGITNLCTCVDSDLKSFIIDGKQVKAWNQWYNKRISILQEIASKDKKAPAYTKQMYYITKKRNNRIYDYIHKACKYIVNYCLQNKINTIILGYNQGWKQNINLGNKTNQQFTHIPFYRLKENLSYLCKLNQIELMIQEESYTSKASFINKDFIPTYGVNDKLANFTGTRIHRGLYQSINFLRKFSINADLNGALNILRKYLNIKSNVVVEYNLYKKLYEALYIRGVLITPKRIRLLPVKVNKSKKRKKFIRFNKH